MHISCGDMQVVVSRDYDGEYDPQLIKKYQNTVTQNMEEKILHVRKRHNHRRHRVPHEGAL